VYNGKDSSEKKCQNAEIGLNFQNQRERVRESIYNIENRLENVTKRIRLSNQISPRNKELIWAFCGHCKAQGLSPLRIIFYLNRFWNIARQAQKDFDQMTRADVEHLVLAIRVIQKKNGEALSERTILDHLTAIKSFWKWLKDSEDETPPEVKWIKTNPSKSSKKLPDELPNTEDVEKLVNAASNARDKALISVLFDSGCRIGELLTLRIKNLHFDEYGGVLLVTGKTGQRRVRIIHSVQRLQTWLEQNPFREQPDAIVFCSLSNKGRGNQLRYEAVSRILKKIRERAHVTKKVNPHAFRHARATLLAQHLTDSQLKQYFGWQADSKMAAVYIHLSGKDLDPALARLAGLTTEQLPNEIGKVKICERCKTVNTHEALRCIQCFSPFVTTEQDEKKKIAEVVFNILRQFGVQVNDKQLTML